MRGIKKFPDEIILEDGNLDAGLLLLSAAAKAASARAKANTRRYLNK